MTLAEIRREIATLRRRIAGLRPTLIVDGRREFSSADLWKEAEWRERLARLITARRRALEPANVAAAAKRKQRRAPS